MVSPENYPFELLITASFGTVTFDSIFYGSGAGLFTSMDGGITWHEHNEGMPSCNVGKMIRLRDGSLIETTERGVYKRLTDSSKWKKVFPVNGLEMLYDQRNGIQSDTAGVLYTQAEHYYATYSWQALRLVYRSIDAGETWALDTSGVFGIDTVNQGYPDLFVNDDGTRYYGACTVGGTARIWKKPSGGSWTLDTVMTPVYDSISWNPLYALLLFASDGHGNVYAELGRYPNPSELFMRSNAGGPWVRQPLDIGAGLLGPIQHDRNGVLFAGGTGSGYYRGEPFARNLNGTWSACPLPPSFVQPYYTMAASVDSANMICAAFQTGNADESSCVLVSPDLGEHWTGKQLVNYDVRNLVAFGDSTFAVAPGIGVFLLRNPGSGSIAILDPRALDFQEMNIGDTLWKYVQVMDFGSNEVDTFSVMGTDSLFDVSPRTFIVMPGRTRTISVCFTPRDTGLVEHSLLIASSTRFSPNTLTVRGSAVYGSSRVADGKLTPVMELFPNPASGMTTLQLPPDAPQTLHVVIVDPIGRTFDVPEEAYAITDSRTMQLDVHRLVHTAGVYRIEISGGRFHAAYRVVVVQH